MSFKSIRKFFGIETYTERHIRSMELRFMAYQRDTDKYITAKLEEEAVEEYNQWKADEEFIKTIDKTKPYWQMRVPLRFKKHGCIVYHVDHDETAKFKGVNFAEYINNRVEELKKSGGKT